MDRYLEYMGLISIMLLSAASAGCPSKCICSRNSVRCTEKSLMDIPNFETLDNDPIVIDLSSNDIDFITYYALSFDKAEVVQILYLNDSKIIDVDDTAFKELISLRELYLSENLLGDLPPNSFKFNENLIYLDLSFNLFRKMPKIISSSLITLNLMNSGIETVDNDRFMDLPNLKYLNLQRNNIRFMDVEIFKYLPKLSNIQLEYNSWKCTCESVQMFNFLHTNGKINIKEPIQCKTENDFFIRIFDEFGVLKSVGDLCSQNKHNFSYNFGGEFNEIEWLPKRINQKEKIYKQTAESNIPVSQKKPEESQKLAKICDVSNNKCMEYCIEYVTTFRFSTYLTFFIILLFTFVIGFILGSLICGQRKSIAENNSASYNSLLKRDNIV
ncbi:hypothetical protein HHI36_011605 [Cryptolaemus montrouzieri]|uniref:Uncharacterized protein n=1 Tax=Cryptolaemus montrouzieri TaxID=559131 RepID=A0ABD2MMA8_9CUCU